MSKRMFSFVGGAQGHWQVTRMATVIGTPLPEVSHITILEDNETTLMNNAVWTLRGVTSYERYVNKLEQRLLMERQPPLDRPQATCASLIPIKKSPIWWALPQDERRAIFETHSHHILTGLRYLPAIARRLHHCHDLDEPFDFLTWFEYAPGDAEAFEQLAQMLRDTEEWRYVDREIDIRLTRT